MILREIVTADIPTLFRLRVQTWHNPHGAEELTRLGITPDSVAHLLATTHRGWIAEVENAPVGFVMGNRATGEMWVIAVLAAFETQGIGRALLAKVESWLFACGHHSLWLTTDPDENYRAVGFYRHLGWQDWKFEHGDRFMRKYAATDLAHLLASMTPVLAPDAYVFTTITDPENYADLKPIGSFREQEGTTLICEAGSAASKGLPTSGRFAMITLQVPSSLEAVGFLARITTALAAEKISCNAVAAFHHDHLFIPQARAADAMSVLHRLSSGVPSS